MVSLPKVYLDIYETSKDVVRLKQRHLIKEVLERLNSLSLPSTTVITKLTSDQIRFFFGDILSLVVDSDSTLQANAISAIEKFLQFLQTTAYLDSSEWTVVRDPLIEEYTKHIGKIRDSSNNANWYKIWCLLIRVLDQDIIRSVYIINKFLAIVEQSFKSPDLDVRAQAFICWKVLIEIFSKYNELIPTKRVKLISIPFRSSHAKNLYAAETKFQSYWLFLVKLSQSQVQTNDANIQNSLELHQDLVFGPFLQFCFGTTVKGGVLTLKQFPKMKERTVYTLIAMLSQKNPEIDMQLENFHLLTLKDSIVTDIIMKNNWKAIIRSSYEATLIIAEQCNGRKKLLELLWHGLVHQIIQTKNPDVYKECCNIIKQLMEVDKDNPEFLMKTAILTITEIFGSHYNFLFDLGTNPTANYVKIFEIITAVTDILLLSQNHYFPANIFEPVIKNIFQIEKYENLTKYWELIKDLIEYLLTIDQLNDFTNFNIKISIWKVFSMILRRYMDAKLFEFRLPSKYEVVNKWIIWPLKKCIYLNENENVPINKILDVNFFIIWKRLMNSSANAEGRSNFVNIIIPQIKLLCDKRDKIPSYDEVLACYIDCMDKTFDKASKPMESLDFIKTALTKTPLKNQNYNKTVEKFCNFICDLNDSQINLIFDEFKSITSALVQAEKTKFISKNCLEMFKKSITDTFKKDTYDKRYLKEFRAALKSDEFVIIPSVWALNPDRLTEHQKEKMKEKKDNIPALYNDMNSDSHSQESSSIKPWTPNKIVIPKGKDQLIISSPKTGTEQCKIEIETPEIQKSPFKKPKMKTSPTTTGNKSPVKTVKESPEISPSEKDIAQENKKSPLETKEKMVKDAEEREKTTGSSTKTNKLQTKPSAKHKISKEDEKLLKTMNIEVTDKKKAVSILNNLKNLKIDTVEGKSLLTSSFKSERRTRKSANPKRFSTEKKVRSIKDQNNLNKSNRRSRKSLTFEHEKSTEPENKTKKNKRNSKQLNDSKEIQEKEVDIKIKNEEKKQTKENVKQSGSTNTSLTSEDEIVESSQRSQSILTRRLRRSSVNIEEISKISAPKSSIKHGVVVSHDEITAEEKAKAKRKESITSVVISETKTISSENTINTPIVNEAKIKDKTNSGGKNADSKKISEMDTELNTEMIITYETKAKSPTKIHNARLTPSKNEENDKNSNSLIQRIIDKMNNSGDKNNSKLRNNLLSEEESPKKIEFPSKSPRKRLLYDKDEDNDSIKTNQQITIRNISKELTEMETDSIIFPSLTQSPSGTNERQSKSLTAKNVISPKVQKLIDAFLEDDQPRMTRSSPKKSPVANNISEMETQLNTQPNLENIEANKNEKSPRGPRKLPWSKKKIETDTEPNPNDSLNTSAKNKSQNELNISNEDKTANNLNTSAENKGENDPKSPSTPKRNDSVYRYMEDKLIESPAYSPIKPLRSIRKSLNQSIIASPECRNFEKKNEEFLNDTLNISPIFVEAEKNEDVMKTQAVISAVDENDRLFDDLKTSLENEKLPIEETKQTSPPRNISTRQTTLLNSPPDRKNTNVSSSPPIPKTKTQSNLTGRGAQLINMIRNRKPDTMNRFSSNGIGISKTNIGKQDELPSSQENKAENHSSPSKNADNKSSGTDVAPPTPHQQRDLLTFSKVLPSPYASPSASILKRKLRNESLEDFESPAHKRKRVSFHDPPVSVTKEYVKHAEEDVPSPTLHTQMKLNRMLQDVRTSTPTNNSIKHSLKRKNRIDSMLELARFSDSSPTNSHVQTNFRMLQIPNKTVNKVSDYPNNDTAVNNTNKLQSLAPHSATTTSTVTTELHECDSSKQIITDEHLSTIGDNDHQGDGDRNRSTNIQQTSVEMDALKFNATADSTTNPNNQCNEIDAEVDEDDIRLITPSPSIYFTDEASVVKYVVEKYTFDEIYEKYSEKSREFLTNKMIRTIFKDLNIIMEKDVRIKTNILEMLSEKHPKEFLDHAVQENLSSVVCDRLNSNAIIDYICELFKTNPDSRKMILDKITNILTMERFNQERHECFMKLLHYEKMSCEEIAGAIEIIIKNRR